MNPMSTLARCITCGLALGMLMGCAPLRSGSVPQPDDPQSHVDAAKRAAGERADLQELAAVLCSDPKQRKARMATMMEHMGLGPEVMNDPARRAQPPAGVFDNLYFLGSKNANAWAVTTSEGIILIDSTNAASVRSEVVGGLRELGLDPQDIKYVLVTHGHSDHYGGAKYLQEQFGVRVLMSAADWQYAYDQYAHAESGSDLDAPPRKDMILGDTFALGDTTIRIVPTPGHTPGTVSMFIPVSDNGQPHVAAMIGGGYPNARYGSPEFVAAMRQLIASTESFARAAREAGADVVLSNHPVNDGSIGKMAALRQRGSGEPNPFVIGRDAVQGFIRIAQECARADVARNAPQP